MEIKNILIYIVCFTLFGCSKTSHNLKKAPDDSISKAETIGRLIHEKDSISAKATDILLHSNRFDKNIEILGWITVKDNDQWVIRFITSKDNEYASVYDVIFSSDYSSSKVVLNNPAKLLPQEHLNMFNARQTALNSSFKSCSDKYNTIVFNGNTFGVDGWIVYLLAATTNPDEIIAGGHIRLEISQDGKTVIRDVLAIL